MIYYRSEGENIRIGINWTREHNTIFQIIVCLPLYPILPTEYMDDWSSNLLKGWRLKVFAFGFRISRVCGPQMRWPAAWNRPFGKQKLIETWEQRMDRATHNA